MKNILKPPLDQLAHFALDITDPGLPVEVKTDSRGILWVNVGPVCVLRICRVKEFKVELGHEPDDKAQPVASSALGEVIGCFEAALAEGLQEALSETKDERLKDLVERRLMHALYAAQNAAPQPVAWPTLAVAIGDPRFHVARGIMGTENMGQDESLRRAILSVLNPSPVAALAQPEDKAQPMDWPLSPNRLRSFLADVHTAAGLVTHGKQCKALGERLGSGVMVLYSALYSAPQPLAEQGAELSDYPPLPEPDIRAAPVGQERWPIPTVGYFAAAKMRAYVDADRARKSKGEEFSDELLHKEARMALGRVHAERYRNDLLKLMRKVIAADRAARGGAT